MATVPSGQYILRFLVRSRAEPEVEEGMKPWWAQRSGVA